MTNRAQGNREIAEFMGHTFAHDYYLNYHKSWDSQIPVWSKLAQQVKEWLPKQREVEILAKEYFRSVRLYEEAVFQNDPAKGHKVLTDLLQWYNTQQKQTP